MIDTLIEIRDVAKIYEMGDIKVHALRGVSLDIQKGELLAIMGPSGSGKSTMMNVLGCLDQPSAGQYYFEGQDVAKLGDDALADVRNRRIGFVFQTFNLLPRTTARKNVELPLVYRRLPARERQERVERALDLVGLADRMDHRPNELSGGQQQRVAIARALVAEPDIIMADEPTGNLDSRSGAEIMTIFQRLNRDMGITVAFVTHDPDIAAHTRRILRLADGRLVADEAVSDVRDAQKTLAAIIAARAANGNGHDQNN